MMRSIISSNGTDELPPKRSACVKFRTKLDMQQVSRFACKSKTGAKRRNRVRTLRSSAAYAGFQLRGQHHNTRRCMI